MSNIRISRAKARSIYAASVLCLVAFGVAAFFGLAKPKIDSTANASSTPSIVYTPAPTISKPEREETASQSSKPDSSNTTSIFLPSEVTEVVTPSANFFVMPLTGDIIKNYSDTQLQYSLSFGDWRLHKAVDIKGITGDRVNSAGDGTVTAVYDDKLLGRTVEINHGNDVMAIYSGLDTVCVEIGDVVSANMEIGTLGKVPCESVETTHLHFSMQVGDKFVSPMNMIGVEN